MSYEEEDTCHMRRRIHDYIIATSLLCSLLHRKLEDVFSKFEKDGSRTLDKAEFARAFAIMGLTLSAEQIEEMFAVSE